MTRDRITLWLVIVFLCVTVFAGCGNDGHGKTPTHAYLQGLRDALHACEHDGAVMVGSELRPCVVKVEAE